jgi:ketosteroid isomerase-like protein
MKRLLIFIIIAFIFLGCSTTKNSVETDSDRKALEQTSIAIRSAFASGDIPSIILYHHPDVIKALGYNKYLKGRDAVEAELKSTFKNFNLNFKENQVENLLIQGNTAIEQTLFTIEGTPKDGSKPFVFKGRAMIVYTRYKLSPTGWASIRELIQPAIE